MNATQALDVLKERIILFHQLNLIETISELKSWFEELASSEDDTNAKNAKAILSALDGLNEDKINLRIQTNCEAGIISQIPPMSLDVYVKTVENRIDAYQSK